MLAQARSSVWVASGLAKISALYGASLVQKGGGWPSRFITPLEYVQSTRIPCLPILISLRGNHQDAVSVARSMIERADPGGVILTADPEGLASRMLRKEMQGNAVVVSGELPARDTRFVNCKSIFTLTALTHQLCSRALAPTSFGDINPNAIKTIFHEAQNRSHDLAVFFQRMGDWQSRQLIILCDGVTSELSITWQSILSEAAILTPVCLDIKDYTHGDHLAAGRQNNAMFLVISHQGTRQICEIFSDRFSQLLPVYHLQLHSAGAQRFWENLFCALNTAAELTGLLGYPNSRPPRHPLIWSWRGWGQLSGTELEHSTD
jgi:hypothetical protein